MENDEMLEVVDDNDQVVGLEERKKIHEDGLLHREVHVIFVTPQKEIIFQHREKDKASWPDSLDATAGGHVDRGEDYITAALREGREETGIEISAKDLVVGGIVRSKIFEEKTGVTNNVIRYCYGYLFSGELGDLKIEQGKIIGFVKYTLSDLENLDEAEKNKFIPERLEEKYMEMYRQIFESLGIN